ncbi:MAG: hypothetical protein GX868_07995 [Actinobacteria bacterium]|nr:hypothetical protein [Actinomycetota bacterium]
MNDALTVLVFSGAWVAFGVVSGVIGAFTPDRAFSRDTVLTRVRAWEDGGRLYDRRLKVRRWKSALPEAGGLFRRGHSKASLGRMSLESLDRIIVETRRAEWVHWANAAFGLTFFAWTEPLIGAVMTVFGFVVHLPFVIVQRYNRARSLTLRETVVARLARRTQAAGGVPAEASVRTAGDVRTTPGDSGASDRCPSDVVNQP